MTAAIGLDIRHLNRDEQLKQLRRQIAAVSGKIGPSRHIAERPDELPSTPESLLPIPDALAAALPMGLPRGAVAVLSGAQSLPVSVAATVSAAGGHVAIVGLPDFGLLAAVEMGADLTRLAMVPEPGTDPVEVAAVLMDGMDLVVLGLAGRSVTATRARALVARARHRGCTLLVTRGDWQDAAVRIEARVSGYEITGGNGGVPASGHGRIGRVRLAVCARGRAVERVGRTG